MYICEEEWDRLGRETCLSTRMKEPEYSMGARFIGIEEWIQYVWFGSGRHNCVRLGLALTGRYCWRRRALFRGFVRYVVTIYFSLCLQDSLTGHMWGRLDVEKMQSCVTASREDLIVAM
ncbi:hypothetical protein DM02DRAFT_440480 [Periconia macrospinosa]|uniref:Uncharacterized protein n=1 Tax=Periconia macrospinosa TaxID=97972 RepID=A0A2V1DMS6_9PLEO|nr:hypothetical protein DM02DRAFT_440480 [Periconia macrospinosa]